MKIASRPVRSIVAMLAALVPGPVRRFLLTRLLGYEIDPTARIGFCLIDVDSFRAGPQAAVSSLSMIRGCERVELGPKASIGPFVWVNAVRRGDPALRPELEREPALVLGYGSALTTLHFVDCCDRVELDDYAVLGGAMSQVLTHTFDYRESRHMCAPVEVGAYTVVGTKNLLMPGVTVGARSIVAGGAVLTGGKYPELTLLAGVPATAKSQLDPEAKLFHRTDPHIH